MAPLRPSHLTTSSGFAAQCKVPALALREMTPLRATHKCHIHFLCKHKGS